VDLKEKVESIGAVDVMACVQCGLCSGSCPVRFTMDISPTQVIRLIQLEVIEEIFSSNTFLTCSTCFSCQIICPRKISVTKIMEALRQIILRKGQDLINVGGIPGEELRKLPPIALVSNFRKTTA